MIDLNIGGACPRRALTYALARALICPSGPLDAPLPKGGLGLVAVNGNLQDGIAMVADIAAKAGRTWLMANFADDHTNICSGIVQLRPTVFAPRHGAARRAAHGRVAGIRPRQRRLENPRRAHEDAPPP